MISGQETLENKNVQSISQHQWHYTEQSRSPGPRSLDPWNVGNENEHHSKFPTIIEKHVWLGSLCLYWIMSFGCPNSGPWMTL